MRSTNILVGERERDGRMMTIFPLKLITNNNVDETIATWQEEERNR